MKILKNETIKEVKKKLLSILLLLTMLISTIQPIFAVEIVTSGTEKWVAGQWDSQVFTTDNKTSTGMLMRRLTNYTSGEQVTTFCR